MHARGLAGMKYELDDASRRQAEPADADYNANGASGPSLIVELVAPPDIGLHVGLVAQIRRIEEQRASAAHGGKPASSEPPP